MAKTLTAVNVNSDTFGSWVTKVNEIITVLSTEIVTANNNANGAVTTGNTYLNGIFSGNTITAFTGIRGGNVQTSNTLQLLSNIQLNSYHLIIGNSTSNIVSNNSTIKLSNSTSNVVFSLSGLTLSNTTILNGNATFGNSTVKTTINSTTIVTGDVDTAIANITSGSVDILTSNTGSFKTEVLVGNTTVNVYVNSTSLTVGQSFVNNSVFKTGNSTANVTLTSQTLTFSNSSGSFVVDGTGLSLTEYNTRFKFANLTSSNTSLKALDNISKTSYHGAEYLVHVKDNANNVYQITKIILVHSNSTVSFMTQYASMLTGTSTDLATFTSTANATHSILNVTPAVANSLITYSRIGLSV